MRAIAGLRLWEVQLPAVRWGSKLTAPLAVTALFLKLGAEAFGKLSERVGRPPQRLVL
jgi:hypothetical protein